MPKYGNALHRNLNYSIELWIGRSPTLRLMISEMRLLAGTDYEIRYRRPPPAMLCSKSEQCHLWVKYLAPPKAISAQVKAT